MDNEGANTELRSWCAHLSSPAAASGRTSSQGVSQVGATEPADLQQCFPKTLVFPRLCFLKAFSHTVSPDLVRSCPGWVAAFSDEIHFQCNYPVFWSRCACEHALLLGLHVSLEDGGILAPPIQQLGVPVPQRQ